MYIHVDIAGKSCQVIPNAYCELVIKQLFLPMVNAATALPEVQQKNFIYLLVATFYNEYRKIVTSNKKLYRCVDCV